MPSIPAISTLWEDGLSIDISVLSIWVANLEKNVFAISSCDWPLSDAPSKIL